MGPACWQAYLIAGLFEESVKYLAVRRVAFKPYVVDPRALIVYSCCAGEQHRSDTCALGRLNGNQNGYSLSWLS